jgi:hypothetical protein
MRFRHLGTIGTIFLVAGLAVFSDLQQAIAADTVILQYRIFQRSLSVDELTTFVETGEISPSLQSYLETSRQNPETVRAVLAAEAPASTVRLDRPLNTRVGGLMLDQISRTIHTPSGEGNRQALRAAIVLSASSDDRVSLIEVIQNYPTSEVVVETDGLVRAYRRLSSLGGRIRNVVENFKSRPEVLPQVIMLLQR